MKILIAGSHFTPAQAVIEELKKDSSVEVVYVGRKYTREGDRTPSVESQVIPQMGVKFVPLTSGRLQRTFTRHTIPSLLKIPAGLIGAFIILLRERPAVVLSFGGYLSVPVVVVAWFLSIPVIIHQQTLMPGLSDKIGDVFASKIALSFADEKQKSSRVILTGNPIRQDIFLKKGQQGSPKTVQFLKEAKEAGKPVVLVTAGNQGSHAINLAVEEGLRELTRLAFIVHQTGDSKYGDFERLQQKKETLDHPNRYLVEKWIEAKDFGLLLHQADLAVSRGGVNTLLELAYFAVPTLVIPLTFLAEQLANARYFTEAGLTRILHQGNLSAGTLVQIIDKMLSEKEELKKRAENARNLAVADSAKRLALETMILAKK